VTDDRPDLAARLDAAHPPDGPLKGSFVDMDGNPMSLGAWAKAYGDVEGRILARDTVISRDGTHVEIRTMWTGVYENGAQLPFGTAKGEGPTLEVLEEYATKAEALDRHSHWVAHQICYEAGN